jgi:Rad3-related DNA helicase
VSLVRRTDEFFSPQGRLSTRWPNYEARAAQRELAADVARVFESGGVLLAEAPTGIGKSLAYLLPAVLTALETDRRVVVATATKSLQDQLFERDLPVLLETLGVELPCARLKGKQNYLCPRALDDADSSAPEERHALEELRGWAAGDPAGDLDRFPASDAEAFRRVRSRVAADADGCHMATCGRARECFWVRARRRAAEAKLVIVNHALLALGGDADGPLPPFDLLVVDEAHRLEGVLLSQLERGASRHRFEEALRLIGTGRRRAAAATGPGGLAARISGLMLPLFDDARREALSAEVSAMTERVSQAREDVERFFATIEPRAKGHGLYGVRERFRSAADLLGADLDPLEALLSHCAQFSRTLARWSYVATDPAAGALRSADDLAGDLERAAGVWTALGAELEHLAEAGRRDWVYWRTAASAPPAEDRAVRGAELHGCPVSVGDVARRLLQDRASAAVLTSATLSAAGDFAFSAARLGLGEPHGCPYEARSYPSPFPLERQMRVFAWTDRGRDEADVVAEVVAALAERTGRNQLALFTAHERLRRARQRLRDLLPPHIRLLAQEWDGSASLVSERFRIERGAVLLGVQSLWEGVDFPGETLEILVVAKLPFSVPDDPLVEARGERLATDGLDPFRADALPEAVLRFRQGVGRLIRRADDRGVLVVCDPRITTASYRRAFLAALPVAPHAVEDAATLAEEAAAFLAAGAAHAVPEAR